MDVVSSTLKKIFRITNNEAYKVAAKFNKLDDIASKADRSEVATKADLEKMARVIIMWMTGLVIGLFAGLSAVIFTASRMLG